MGAARWRLRSAFTARVCYRYCLEVIAAGTAMPHYRSRTTTHGRNMAGARALWRATGMKNDDFGKPIIAVANSITQFVPGHEHLKDLGQLVISEIEQAGGVGKEFNTIGVEDGNAE